MIPDTPEVPAQVNLRNDTLKITLDAYRHMSFGMAWAMLVVCCVGVGTNTMSIIIYTHRSMRRTPINILLTGLSVIDLSLSLLSIPAFIVPGFFTYYRTWILEIIMCYSAVFVYPLTSTTHTASIWTFVIIAVERWHAVRQGGQGECDLASIGRQRSLLRNKRRRTCIYALVVVCVLSLLYNLVRFFEFELVTYESAAIISGHSKTAAWTSGRSNEEGPSAWTTVSPAVEDSADWTTYRHERNAISRRSSPYTVPVVVPLLRNSTAYPSYMQIYFVGLYLVTHFAVPFVSLVFVNGLTLRVVHSAQQRRKRLLTSRERKEHRTTRMMITVVLMFVFCYTLVLTLNIIEAIDSDWFQTDENRLLAYLLNDISNLLVIINAASTAVIYYVFNRRYRELCLASVAEALGRICPCFWHKHCVCRRGFLEFLQRHQHILDRRRSTVVSMGIDRECNKTAAELLVRRVVVDGSLETCNAGDGTFLVVPMFITTHPSRYSSSSSLDKNEEHVSV